MKNKGFSVIEILILIAILGILIGVFTPMVIKYINKSRLGADITTGKEIASAILEVLEKEGYQDDATNVATPHPIDDMRNDNFKTAVFGIMQAEEIKAKSKKDVDGKPLANQDFYYTLDSTKRKVEIYCGGTTAEFQVYPKVGKKLLK